MTIDDHLLKPANNNLTMVRLVLASLVIYTHCHEAATRVLGVDDLSPLFGETMAYLAVDGFFALSGFLVYRSITRGTPVVRFIESRAARLLPGLAVMLVLVAAAGALVTVAPLPAYLTGHATLRFLAGNLTFLAPGYTLTGVLCGGAPCNVNGALWTIPWEVRCYVLLVLFMLTGVANRRMMLGLILPATLAFAIVWDVPVVAGAVREHLGNGIWFNLDRIDRLWTAFAIGILVCETYRRLVLSWWIAAALVVVAIVAAQVAPGASRHLLTIAVAYAALCLGFLTARRRAVSATWPDYSYGIYIYGFPVMTAIQRSANLGSPYLLAALVYPVTLILAAASWHAIEKPVLEFVRKDRARRALSRGSHPVA